MKIEKLRSGSYRVRICRDGVITSKVYKSRPSDLQKYINSISNLAKKTISSRIGFVRTIINYYNAEFVFSYHLPKKAKKRAYIPNDEDIQKLLNCCKGSEFEIAIKLGLCGMRISEIIALTIDDITDNGAYIHCALVQGVYGKEITRTKTESSTRFIYLPSNLIGGLLTMC